MFNRKLKEKLIELEIENTKLKLSLEKQNTFMTKFIMFFNTIMSGHDDSLVTSKHIDRVADITKDFFMFCDKQFIIDNTLYDYEIFKNSVILGAYLHDIGKFHIQDEILNKQGRLTELEFEIVKQHPKFGSIDLIELPIDETIYSKSIINNIVLHHHSNNDGSGYPNGLTEDIIPFEAKIVAVCDRLEAIMAKRSYKEPKTLEESIQILKNDGKKIDLRILKVIEDNKDYFKKYEE